MRSPVPADQAEPPSRRKAVAAAALLCAALPVVHAQSARTLSVVPTFSASALATDNRTLDASRQSDVVTEVSPGVRILSSSGPVQGRLEYQLTGVVHAHNSELNETRNTFDASMLVSPFEGRLSVAAAASLRRQTISAFGTQATDSTLETRNTTEVASVSITPTLRGSLGREVDYDLQISRAVTRAKATNAGDSDNSAARLHLGGNLARFGWGLDASRERQGFRGQSSTTSDRGVGSLSYRPDYDLTFTARAGAERSDSLGLGADRTKTYGLGANWTPSPRTTFSADADKRYFGHSHRLSLQHRMASTFVSYSDSRDINSTSGSRPGLTLLDLALISNPKLPGETDIEFEDRLRQMLTSRGAEPSKVVTRDFLIRNRSVSRGRQLAWTYSNPRSSATLTAFRTDTRRLINDELLGDLNDPPVTQFGYSVWLSHRLTPRDSLAVTYQRSRTADSGLLLGNDQRSVNVLWTTQPGVRTSISLGGRHVEFDGAQPYNENAITATLGLRF